MVFTASGLYRIQTAGLDAFQLVLTGTVLELSVFLFEIPTGVVADVYSRKLSVIVGTVLIGAGFMVEAGWTAFGTILLAQVLWGVGYTFTSGALQAWITDEIGEECAGKVFLQETQVSQPGALLGTALGAALGSLRLTLPMMLGGAAFILTGLLLALLMPETNFHPAGRGERTRLRQMLDTFRDGLEGIGARPDLRAMLGIALFFGFYSEGFDRLWQAHMLAEFQFPLLPPVAWFAIISAAGMLSSTAAAGIAARRVDTARTVKTLAGVSIALLLGLLAFALVGSLPLAIAAYICIHTLRTMVDPLMTGWINRGLDPQVRATVLSMRSQVDSLGQISGGPGVGWIARQNGYRAGLLVSTLLLSPVLGLFFYLIKKNARSGRLNLA